MEKDAPSPEPMVYSLFISIKSLQLRILPTKNGENVLSPSTEPHADGRPTYNGVWPGSPGGLSVSEVDCFCAVWNDSLPESSNVFHAAKNHLYVIKNKIVCCAFRCYFVFYYWYFIRFLTTYHFKLKMYFYLVHICALMLYSCYVTHHAAV
jgi:hypothetical protein